MPIDLDRLADDVMEVEKKPPSIDIESLADSLLEGHQAAASELLQSNFEPGAYASNSLRFSLARGDNLEEKKLRLKKKYPQGDIEFLPESLVMGFDEDTLVFRESPQAQWKMVEPQGFDRFDIPEAIAPSVESIVGESIMAMKILPKNVSVPLQVGAQVLGAVFGEAFEQGFQYLSGTQAQTPAGAGGEILTEGAYSAVGGFAMSPIVAMKNAATGAGALRVGDEGIDTIRAAKELDPKIAEGLTPALVTDNPAVRLSEAQSAALLPGLPRRYRELIDLVDTAVKTSAPGNSANAMGTVTRALSDFGDYFLKRISTNGTPMSKGGAALREGVAQYKETSGHIVKELYERARMIEEPVFDLKPVLDLAADLRKGAKGAPSKQVQDQLRILKNIKEPIKLNDGSVVSVTDQIRNVRTALHELAHVEPGKAFTQANGQANDAAKAITAMLKDPENTSGAFRAAWKAANDAASDRFAKLEAAPIIAAAKNQNPAELVKSYVRPGQVDNLLAIRNTIPANKWRMFVDAAYSDLALDPTTISKNINAFDQETLDVFMPRAEQVLWKRVGREIDRITSVGVDSIKEIQIKNRNFIDTLITSSSPRDTQTLIRAANNTNNKAMRESLRAAIVEWSWDGVVKKGKNKLLINDALIKTRVDSLKRNGLWSVLSPEERRIISNAEIVSRAFKSVVDAGTSIQAAEAVQGAKQLQKNAIMTFLRSEILAQFYLSSGGRKLLIGSGMPHSNGAILRLMGGSLAQISQPRDITELVEEQ